ncbi:hypothetical protein [Tritonibacter horizontis]|uniref:Uncharacterized protein n=1 Tax=Tritonibacter horizontis TaxID=1768241 RepID=A0A132BW69_9RHOB|nr:hypothetical protein [Tritonibacter horizontis]KUP92302.1 hypothetical protein TRIHO_27900 [Tritonibacter horizontis]
MTTEQLLERACRLEQEIRSAPEIGRLDFAPEFSKVMTRIRASGMHVPGHLRRTEEVLHDELVETHFDNMPV